MRRIPGILGTIGALILAAIATPAVAYELAGRVVALTPGASVVIDGSRAQFFTLVPNQATAVTAINTVPSIRYTLLITTSGTTSYTLSFGSGTAGVSSYATGTSSGAICSLAFQGTSGGTLREDAGTCRPLVVGAPAAGDIESVALAAPAAGIGVAGSPCTSGACSFTLSLANDLAALEGLSTTGLVTRTGDGTATTRAVTGTANEVTVTNGDGVSGAPTIAIASVLDLSGKTQTMPVKAGTSPPGTCTARKELFIDTDTGTAGERLLICNGTGDGWDTVGDGSGVGGAGDITQVWGCTSGDCSTLTAAAGDTIDSTGADSTQPVKAGTALPGSCVADKELFIDTDATNGQQLYICDGSGTSWNLVGDGGGGGSSIVLDLADDGSDESAGVTEIATTNDNGSAFTEPSANKLLIDVSKLRPASYQNPRESPHAADCEFSGSVCSWTWSNSGTSNPVSGTVDPTAAVSGDPIYDLTSVPGRLYVQTDETSNQRIHLVSGTWTWDTNATLVVRVSMPDAGVDGSVYTDNEGFFAFFLLKDGDADDYVYVNVDRETTSNQRAFMICKNAGADTTAGTATQPANTVWLARPYVVVFKKSNTYYGYLWEESGSHVFIGSCAKTGTTDLNKVQLSFATADNTPSIFWSVDFFRYYASATLGFLNE